MLSGKKTYLVAAGIVLYNIFGMFLSANGMEGGIATETGVQGIMYGLGFAGLRAGIAKNGN